LGDSIDTLIEHGAKKILGRLMLACVPAIVVLAKVETKRVGRKSLPTLSSSFWIEQDQKIPRFEV
jgi:hypothetical protein